MSHQAFALSFALIAAMPFAAHASSDSSHTTQGASLDAAQGLPYLGFEYEQTTGWVSNESDRAGIVASLHVELANAESLRLLFGKADLAGGTLRIVSLEDEAVQVLDQRALEQWSHSTAWFNGNAVLVDLILDAGAGPAIVTISSLEFGTLPLVVHSQCGPNDDRVPSDDARVARLLPSGCTAWMIDDCAKCFLSAGHCGAGNNMVEFNVPFSKPNGAWNHPPPSDQYPIDSSSVQSQNNFGADWLYFGTFPNSTTGMTAFEAQGSAFTLANPPSTAGNTIRITGHGADSSPNSTYNQIQQTHSGPFTNSGNPLNYKVDTEGGNSGSPVIWEEEDVAIGIHTNAGCSTSGAGANSGTNITNANLQAALSNPLGICAGGGFGGPFADLGESLTNFPFSSAPELKGCGSLETGTAYELTQLMPPNFENLAPGSSTVLIAGFSPLNLPFEGGTIVPSFDVVQVLPITTISNTSSVTISGTWSLASGTKLYAQFWTPFTSIFGSNILASNAIELTTP